MFAAPLCYHSLESSVGAVLVLKTFLNSSHKHQHHKSTIPVLSLEGCGKPMQLFLSSHLNASPPRPVSRELRCSPAPQPRSTLGGHNLGRRGCPDATSSSSAIPPRSEPSSAGLSYCSVILMSWISCCGFQQLPES